MNEYQEFNGYSLFTDLEDKEAQIYNRARVMKNMMMDNSKDKVVNAQGKFLIIGYMNQLPTEDRATVYSKLEELLKQKEVV